MKSSTTKGIIAELIYLVLVVSASTQLPRLGIQEVWPFIAFMICLPQPIRKNNFIDIKQFSWNNWKQYLIHTLLSAAIIILVWMLFQRIGA